MASPIAHAPHSGPVDTPGEGAYLYARAGVARSATTRSNFVAIQTSIDWIVRDDTGAIVSTTDLSGLILHDSLRVTQAINDEPDTCSFTLRPQDPPALVPKTGDEIRISWAPGGPPLFHGYVLVTQADWRVNNLQPPWVSVQCQDSLWRFDARIVTYRFPAQSVTASIAFLVQHFCNLDPAVAGPLDFSTAFVQAGMPSIPSFDVVNQRPSTVMRTLMASVGGGFYLEGLTLHAWANSASEPNQTNPTPLTVGLKTLHTFRRTEDATQVRRAVIVEGRRTSTLASIPTSDTIAAFPIGVPLTDATLFNLAADHDADQLVRMGTQWVRYQFPISVTANGASPPQTRVQEAFVVGSGVLVCDPIPGATLQVNGWIRIGNQYAAYQAVLEHTGAVLRLALASDVHAYGQLTVPVAVGETVEWLDCTMEDYYMGALYRSLRVDDSPLVYAQPVETPVVTLAVAERPIGAWPPLVGFVQDGRYSYAGAQARADSELAAFEDPLISVEWQTDDLNAIPGRSQVIALASDTINPPINRTVTILRVEISFPLRTLPPRRTCSGGIVKPSTFLDLVVTTQN